MNTPLSRAKNWIARNSHRAALTVLPLAAAAVSVAHGAVVLPTNSTDCRVSGFGSVQPDCTVSQLAPGVSGDQGVRWTFNSPYTWSGGYADFEGAASGVIGGTGTLPSAIPVALSFNITSGQPVTGTLYLTLRSSWPHGYATVGSLVLPFSGGSLSLTDSIPVELALSAGEEIYANFNFYYNDPNATVNSFTLDLIPAAPINEAPVPEPGTVALTGGAIGLLALRIQRRRTA